MDMLVGERYARYGVAFVAADDGTGLAARSVIGDEVLATLGHHRNGKRKIYTEHGEGDAEESHRSKVIKIKDEPDEEDISALHTNRPSKRPIQPKIKKEPGAISGSSRPTLQNKKNKKRNKGRGYGNGKNRELNNSESQERIDNFGFSAVDLNTVLSYGAKPWEDGAWDMF